VICRVFNKTGDRKNVGLIHNQISYLHNHSLSTTHHHHHEALPLLIEPSNKTLTNFPSLLYDDPHQNYNNNNFLHGSSGHNIDELKALINPVVSQLNGIIFPSGNNNNDEDDFDFNLGVKTEQSSNGNEIDVRDYLENPLFQEASYGLLGFSSSPGPLHMLLDSPCPLGFQL